MKLKYLFLAMLSLFIFALSGCGSDANGLNGGLDVTADKTGAVITATATYTNPTETNLIGVPIRLSYRVGAGTEMSLGEFNTNNTGKVSIAFTPLAFTGTQTVTVIARTGDLTNFATVELGGSTISVTPPPAINQTVSVAAATPVNVAIPGLASFVTIDDPFTGSIANHPIQIQGTAVSGNGSVVDPTDSVTDISGTASFPGTTATVIAPAVGASEVVGILWTVTDTVTGFSSSARTDVTLTNEAP